MLTSILMPCVLLVAGQAAEPEDFYQDFRNARSLLPELALTGPNLATSAVPEAAGLHLTLPARRADTAPVGLQGKFEVLGDCQITGGYDLLAADQPTNKYNFVGVNLYAAQYNGRGHVKFGRYNTLERGQVYMAQICDRDKTGPPIVTRVFSAAAQAGEMCISRQGSKLSFLVKDSTTGGELKELLQEEFNASPLGVIRFVLTTNGEPVAAEARLLDLRVQSKLPRAPVGTSAPAIAPPATRRPGSRALFLAIAAALAIAAGATIWLRRRSDRTAETSVVHQDANE